MAIPYERLVAEDLHLGYGSAQVTMPAGGFATGALIGLHTLWPGRLSALDLGATADGGGNDATAIQAAITALGSQGGVVVVPRGTYRLSTAITFTHPNVLILLDAGVTFTGSAALPTPAGSGHVLDLGAINLDRLSDNVMMGYQAGANIAGGAENVFIGPYAGRAQTTASFNCFIGQRAGLNNTSGNFNCFVGGNTGLSNTTGSLNTFIGACGNANTSGERNTFVGYTAGNLNTIGADNVFVGVTSGATTVDGFGNTMIGAAAGALNVSGNSNTFVGNVAGAANVNSNFNTYVGKFCGFVETGQANAYYGYKAGPASTSGNRNTYLGNSAAFNFLTASDNTVVGYDAGHGMAATAAGGGHTLIGSLATITAPDVALATAVGYDSHAADRATALGYGGIASGARSVCIGALSRATSDDAFVLGDPAASLGTTRVGVGTANPHACALLELNANNTDPKVFLLPRISTTQRDSLTATMGAGYGFMAWIIGAGLQCYDGVSWKTATLT